jgi:hypothetical protein
MLIGMPQIFWKFSLISIVEIYTHHDFYLGMLRFHAFWANIAEIRNYK